MNESQQQALERAIEAAGGITKLANALGLKSHTVIQGWRRTRVPASYCPAIESLTGVRCEALRPDVGWEVLRRPHSLADAQPVATAQQGVGHA